MKKRLVGFFINLGVIFGLFILTSPTFSQEEPSFSSLSLWLGSHYTGFSDFYKKVGEFDRGKEGVLPEIFLDYSGYKGNKSLEFFGHYYDPKRFSFKLSGRSKDVFSGILSYRSFYRQREKDLLTNLMICEATDQLNTPPGGGKMVTYDDQTPNANFGYTRHQIKSDFKVKVPGKARLKIIASHRSILEKGRNQKVVSMHCSSCHMVSKSIDVDQLTHTASVGFEVNPKAFLLSYIGSFRSFKSEAPLPEAFYDAAEHPTDTTKGKDFPERVIFHGDEFPFGKISQNQKIAHTVKIQTEIGKNKILGSFTNSQAKNISEGIEIKSNGGTLKYVVSPSLKTKVIASASLSRIENDSVIVDYIPVWSVGDSTQFDFIRYSNLTRTVGKGSAEFIYQPERKYRLSFLAGYEQIKRDDYPGSDGKTTKLKFSIKGKYRPNLKFSARFKYFFENTKDPAPYNLIFERSAKTASSLYYYEREELRYGQITNQPIMLNGVDFTLNFNPNRKTNFKAGLKASLETNSDTDTLDFERTKLQPHLSINFAPTPKWNLFTNLSYIYNKSNGLAAVAMMDG